MNSLNQNYNLGWKFKCNISFDYGAQEGEHIIINGYFNRRSNNNMELATRGYWTQPTSLRPLHVTSLDGRSVASNFLRLSTYPSSSSL